MKIIDLTRLLEPDVPSDPPEQIPKIQYMDHKEAAPDGARNCHYGRR